MISIATPNYNGEKWLGEYFDSLATQTLPQEEIEVLFVDDGSSDTSLEIAKSYKENIPGLHIIQSEHTARPGELRNIAMRQAIGRYVLFLDSDDYLGAEALERLDDFSQNNPSDIFAFQLEGVNRSVPRSMLSKTVVDADLVDSGLYKTLGAWKMVDRQFIIDNDITFSPDFGRGEDVLFFTEAMLKARRLSILSGYAFYMLRGREDGSSITQDKWDPKQRLNLVRHASEKIINLAKDKNTRDHFMIRMFNTDAIGIAESHTIDNETMDTLKQTLGPYWSKDLAGLVYTEENRQKLINIFGEPKDEQ